MTDKEFIAGIIAGDYTINDVAKYCKTIVDVNALCDVMIGEYWDGFDESKLDNSYFDPITGKYVELNPDYGKKRLWDAIYYIEKEILHNAPELPKNCKHMADGNNAEPPKEEVTMHQCFNGDEACKYKRYAAIKAYCKDNDTFNDLVNVFVIAHKLHWIKAKPSFSVIRDLQLATPINPKTQKPYTKQNYSAAINKYYDSKGVVCHTELIEHIADWLEKAVQA